MSWPFVVLSAVGVALYAFAVVRYLALWRERGSDLILALAVAFILLAESMVAVALGRNWQASWWEWHVLMLLAFGLIAVMAHREGPQERFARLYLDKDAAARDSSVRRPRGLQHLLGAARSDLCLADAEDPLRRGDPCGGRARR